MGKTVTELSVARQMTSAMSGHLSYELVLSILKSTLNKSGLLYIQQIGYKSCGNKVSCVELFCVH